MLIVTVVCLACSFVVIFHSYRSFILLYRMQDELVAMMNKEGFVFTNYVNFTFGVVAVHSGFKM